MRQTCLDEKPAHAFKLPSLLPALFRQLAHGLLRQGHAVQLGQLLAGQRRNKVGIAFADDLNRTFSKAIGQLVVAGLIAPTISHNQRAVCAVALEQAATVVVGNTETLSSEMCRQPPVDNVLNDFKPVNLVYREKFRIRSHHIKGLSR